MGYKMAVEIGVAQAQYTEFFCKAGIFIFGVDPWEDYPEIDLKDDYTKDFLERAYDKSKSRLAPYINQKLLKMTSVEALKLFPDGSVDFVYIDGNHCLKYVIEDLCNWWVKLKKGGTMAGHDYIHPRRLRNRDSNMHVKFAVDAFVEAYGIKNWFLLGRHAALPGEKRDKPTRSWMWLKE
jgi:hypothetical protein